MARYTFEAVIPWHILKKHLEQQQKATDSQLRRAVEPEASVLRGRAQFIEQLFNLPDTLQTLDDEDQRVENETNK